LGGESLYLILQFVVRYQYLNNNNNLKKNVVLPKMGWQRQALLDSFQEGLFNVSYYNILVPHDFTRFPWKSIWWKRLL
jgi:hypothetical protein